MAHAYSHHQVPDVSVTWDSPETCVRQKSTPVNQILVSMVTVLIWSATLPVPVGMVLRDYYVQVTCYNDQFFSKGYWRTLSYFRGT